MESYGVLRCTCAESEDDWAVAHAADEDADLQKALQLSREAARPASRDSMDEDLQRALAASRRRTVKAKRWRGRHCRNKPERIEWGASAVLRVAGGRRQERKCLCSTLPMAVRRKTRTLCRPGPSIGGCTTRELRAAAECAHAAGKHCMRSFLGDLGDRLSCCLRQRATGVFTVRA
jgi:hypothetical protein